MKILVLLYYNSNNYYMKRCVLTMVAVEVTANSLLIAT